MKLVFPRGDRPQTVLSVGDNTVGSDADASVVIEAPGVAPLHCTIVLSPIGGAVLRLAPLHPVRVNGRVAGDLIALRDGDLLAFGDVEARIVTMPVAAGTAGESGEDADGATRLRAALPKLLLRGVSGAAFGKVYPVAAPVVIGRAPECDITLASEEISRRHAQLRPMADGVLVEDLDSANGTWVNDERIQSRLLRPGDELRLDTMRFLLVAPGLPAGAAPPPPAVAPAARGPRWTLAVLLSALAALIGCGAAWLLLR